MTVTEFQQWLNAHGASIAVDGKGGPATRAAILQVFTNKSAPAITETELRSISAFLGDPRDRPPGRAKAHRAVHGGIPVRLLANEQQRGCAVAPQAEIERHAAQHGIASEGNHRHDGEQNDANR